MSRPLPRLQHHARVWTTATSLLLGATGLVSAEETRQLTAQQTALLKQLEQPFLESNQAPPAIFAELADSSRRRYLKDVERERKEKEAAEQAAKPNVFVRMMKKLDFTTPATTPPANTPVPKAQVAPAATAQQPVQTAAQPTPGAQQIYAPQITPQATQQFAPAMPQQQFAPVNTAGFPAAPPYYAPGLDVQNISHSNRKMSKRDRRQLQQQQQQMAEQQKALELQRQQLQQQQAQLQQQNVPQIQQPQPQPQYHSQYQRPAQHPLQQPAQAAPSAAAQLTPHADLQSNFAAGNSRQPPMIANPGTLPLLSESDNEPAPAPVRKAAVSQPPARIVDRNKPFDPSSLDSPTVEKPAPLAKNFDLPASEVAESSRGKTNSSEADSPYSGLKLPTDSADSRYANALGGPQEESTPAPRENGKAPPVPETGDGRTGGNLLSGKEIPGLRGYCLVTLRKDRQYVAGQPHYQVEYQSRVYSFASEEAKQEFERHPDRYAPADNGADLVATNAGNAGVNGSLDHAVWFKGRLYLFSSEENKAAFKANPKKFTN